MRFKLLLAAALLLTVVSVTSLATTHLDDFLSRFSSGNLHTLIGMKAVEVIKTVGVEPQLFDYYQEDRFLFSYQEENPFASISGIVFLWREGKVDEIRIFFSQSPSITDVFSSLGYSQSTFTAMEQFEGHLGVIPYSISAFHFKTDLAADDSDFCSIMLRCFLNHITDGVNVLMVTLEVVK